MDGKFFLRVYNNSYWASDPYDRKSTSGSCVFIGFDLVSWSAKKQSLIARSSVEAEYRGLTHQQWNFFGYIHLLLTELIKCAISCPNTIMWQLECSFIVSQSHIALADEANWARHTFCSWKDNLKDPYYMPCISSMQLEYVFTKPLGTSDFFSLSNKLGIVSLP